MAHFFWLLADIHDNELRSTGDLRVVKEILQRIEATQKRLTN
ncbi:hypothetical protein [Rhizobium sp. BT03]|nr:hypothetical protein [Rhizobium sp. BT03]WHO71567.1 hypothetical protein QMO80_000564 [Rhizobium sp. BT03]